MRNIFIISGPSGAGEDSIINGLSELFPLERIVTTTTRSMRPGESQGDPYYFVSVDEFKKRLDNGEFVEYAQQYNGNLYGVTKEEIERVAHSGKIGTWKIEYKGVEVAKKLFPEIVAIFVNAPSLEILESRIRRRDNVSEEYIRERMEYTKEWLKHTDSYDEHVINEEGKLKEAVAQVATIIRKTAPREIVGN
ncbi:MAG TPA: guanylate kinase [Candidatus Moranbacteria bacterium]|nr:guanylate kinase [Candidatus Moranbacteria bacterium]